VLLPFSSRISWCSILYGIMLLQYARNELHGDKDVVLAAVKESGFALQCASTELRADKEVVLAAVKQDGDALGFASKELQKDEEVILAAKNK
jgi:hypothetical protein